MREYIELGPTPCDEKCQQVGDSFNPTFAAEEMRCYIKLLKQLFPGSTDVRCGFGIKSFPHDFGNYSEVVIYYNSNDQASIDFAFNVENNLPSSWYGSNRQFFGPNYLTTE